MERTGYHHGDLKRALVDTALEVLREDGLQALSLRKVARRAGVSHNAPYMHFADKNALLAAVADDGFGKLGDAMREARDATAAGSLEQLLRLGRAYVSFAADHPQHFLVMFTGPERTAPGKRERGGAGLATFELLVDLMASAQRAATLGTGSPREMALGFWSLLHGVATLDLAGSLGPDVLADLPAEDLRERLIRHLLRGLGADA